MNKGLGEFTKGKKKQIKIWLCGKSGKDSEPDVIAVDLIHLCPFIRDLCPYCDYSMDREQSPLTADARYVDVLQRTLVDAIDGAVFTSTWTLSLQSVNPPHPEPDAKTEDPVPPQGKHYPSYTPLRTLNPS